MKTVHILNGDCLAEIFPKEISGEIIVWRECLIDGPLPEENFFETRKAFIEKDYAIENANYQDFVIKEFEKIQNIPEKSAVYFWFEDDLFCQINFWFLVSLLKDETIKMLRVFPDTEQSYSFNESKNLTFNFQNSVEIDSTEKNNIFNLWQDYQKFQSIKENDSKIVRNLEQLKIANQNRFNGTLNKELHKISAEFKNFNDIFAVFNQKFKIYGFGDLQVKNLLNNL